MGVHQHITVVTAMMSGAKRRNELGARPQRYNGSLVEKSCKIAKLQDPSLRLEQSLLHQHRYPLRNNSPTSFHEQKHLHFDRHIPTLKTSTCTSRSLKRQTQHLSQKYKRWHTQMPPHPRFE